MAEDKDPIINCHIHTFTLDHVPNGFLPPWLTKLLKHAPFRTRLVRLMRRVWRFSSRDRLDRYANFLETGAKPTQGEIFDEIRGFYPKDTKFINLPMDMAYMGAGAPQKDIDNQHSSLVTLAKTHPDQALPFLSVDPRRFTSANDLLSKSRQWLEETHSNGDPVFHGIKIYPPQGHPVG